MQPNAPPSVDPGPKIEVPTSMPFQMASGMVWERFWHPRWVPKRDPERVQIRPLMYISRRSRKRRFMQAFFLHYQHCEDAILLWKKCFEGFSLPHSCRFCLSSYHAETSKLVSKSLSKVFQNGFKTLFEVTCVLETLLGQVWNDFRLPNDIPREVLEASSRPSKTFSF